ncbi:hypothetical protein RDn1_257 [Candidatus Termititenax dinenymphae]|uniref:Uncharacterized protein n=1 Tax=Candidatus Termititenax dinenymphae TaxID=2218523 RepID=A0A388TJW5_9BACT|nr:hypothetical protein RDn1_257 [Candidatus Termititenax dinenymphae]
MYFLFNKLTDIKEKVEKHLETHLSRRDISWQEEYQKMLEIEAALLDEQKEPILVSSPIPEKS